MTAPELYPAPPSDALEPNDDGGYFVAVERDVTYADFYALFGPGPPVNDQGEYITAAGPVHDGAMIALVPSAEDAVRLAIGGGEALDELHLTLVYLGDAVNIEAEERQQVLDRMRSISEDINARVVGHAFGVAKFNPTGDEPCVVLLVGGDVMEDVHDVAVWAAEESGVDTSLAKKPWIPHVTLMYTDGMLVDADDLEQRMGPITFDRVRVAFGGEVHDFTLGAPIVASAFHMPGKHNQKDHARGGGKSADGPSGDGPSEKGVTGQAAHDACPVGLERSDSDLTTTEKGMLHAYRGDQYVLINGGLREPPPPAGVQPAIDSIDGVMSRSRLTETIETERGLSSGRRVFGDAWDGDLTGAEFTERGYISTTTDTRISREEFHNPRGRAGARVVMTVPAGTGAVDLGHGRGEAEILLERGLTLRITSDTGPGPDRVLTMEVVT